MSNRLSGECDGTFSCPSGCIGPEACLNMRTITALREKQKRLEETIGDSTQFFAIKALHGDLKTIRTRTADLVTQDAALAASCGVWQEAKYETGTIPVSDDKLPPLD